LANDIPSHYYPQIQHQIYVADVPFAYYFSFDGFDGVIVEIERNEKYIENMIEQEKEFYECLINKIPPETKRIGT
jgi:predicted phage-related endonuclease